MPTIEFTPPSEIDGAPEEVLRHTLSQLEAVTPAIQELVDQSVVQVKSTWLSFELASDEGSKLSPDELAAKWEGSELSKRCRHARAAAVLLRRTPKQIAALAGGRGRTREGASGQKAPSQSEKSGQ